MYPVIVVGNYAVDNSGFAIEQGPIRPPSESDSLLVRVNRNCPWNRCKFCGIYGDGQYSVRSLNETLSDIDVYKQIILELGLQDYYQSAFLQDGNALAMRTKDLVDVISYLKNQIPSIRVVTTYSSSRIVSAKKQEDLIALAQAGLSRIHIGLETGYGPLLEYMNKGATPEIHIDAGRKVKEAGISILRNFL